jgi:hypothetical protein
MALPRGPLLSPAPVTPIVTGAVHNVTPPAPADQQACALQCDSQGNLLVNVAVGGGGGSSNVNIADINGVPPALTNPLPVELSDGTNPVGTAGNPLSVNVITGGGSNASVGLDGAPAPTSSTQVGGSDGVNLQPLQVDASKNLKVVVNAPLPAGTNVIGHAITDTGSTTAVTGNVTVVQPTGTNLHVVVDSGSSLTAAVTGTKSNNAVVPDANNLGVLPAIANAATQTWTEGDQVLESVDLAGRQRIRGTLTHNNAAPVADGQMALSALANAVAPTYTEGDLVLESVDLNGNHRVIGTKTNNAAPPSTQLGVIPAVANAAAPTWTEGDQVLLSEDLSGRLRVLTTPAAGATTAIVGGLTNNNAAPAATEIGVLPALANAVSPLWTEGKQVLESVDLNGSQRTMAGNIPEVTATWTNATTINTALTMANITGYSYITVTLNSTGVTTPGVITFEVSDTGTTWYGIWANQLNINPAGAVLTYAFISGTLASFTIPVTAWNQFRIRLSTAITGAGSVAVGMMGSAGSWTQVGAVSLVTITGINSVRSAGVSAALADNQVNENFFISSAGVNNPLAVGDWVYGGAFSGAADAARQGWNKMRAPTVFRTVSATASGNTAIWTPGSGNKFRLLQLFIQVSDNASLAAGGVLVVDIQDATTSTNITFSVFVPTTAVTTVIGDGAEISLNLGAFGILSAAANNVLNVNLSSALATGVCRIIAMGTEE